MPASTGAAKFVRDGKESNRGLRWLPAGVSAAPNGQGERPTLITRGKAQREQPIAELKSIDADDPDD